MRSCDYGELGTVGVVCVDNSDLYFPRTWPGWYSGRQISLLVMCSMNWRFAENCRRSTASSFLKILFLSQFLLFFLFNLFKVLEDYLESLVYGLVVTYSFQLFAYHCLGSLHWIQGSQRCSPKFGSTEQCMALHVNIVSSKHV